MRSARPLFLLAAAAFLTASCSNEVLPEADLYRQAVQITSTPHSGPRLIIWSKDYMTGFLIGTVVTEAGVTHYATQTSFTGSGADRVGPIETQRSDAAPDAMLSHFQGLRAYNGQNWSCPMMDGGRVLIEGELDGERFALAVDNPDACSDRRSQAVVQVIALVPPFDFGETE
jgi:hypothetical protein